MERELVALLVVDRARIDAAELVGEERGHLALLEVRRRVVEPAREIDRDVAAATSHAVHRVLARVRARESPARPGSVRARGRPPPQPLGTRLWELWPSELPLRGLSFRTCLVAASAVRAAPTSGTRALSPGSSSRDHPPSAGRDDGSVCPRNAVFGGKPPTIPANPGAFRPAPIARAPAKSPANPLIRARRAPESHPGGRRFESGQLHSGNRMAMRISAFGAVRWSRDFWLHGSNIQSTRGLSLFPSRR